MCQEDFEELANSRDGFLAVSSKIQNLMIRQNMSAGEEKLMLEKAKAKGVVRIEISTPLTYDAAQDLANKEAGGLCTLEELVASGVNAGNMDLWMYVRREDGTKDVVQLGQHPTGKERYISHSETFGPADWLNKESWGEYRPLSFIYAKAKAAE